MTQHETQNKRARIGTFLLTAMMVATLSMPSLAWGGDNAPSTAAKSSAALTAGAVKQSTSIKTTASKPSVTYQVKMNKTGWSVAKGNGEAAGTIGDNRRIYSIKASLNADPSQGGIAYRTHLSSGKWTKTKADGKAVGSSKKVDAISITLTGPIAEKYDVVYRAHVEGIGWQRRMRNGESAGLEGWGCRIDAVKISIVSKKKASGWVWDDGWTYRKNGKRTKSAWVETDEHPIDTALAGKQKYWLDSNGWLAVDRYIVPKNANDAAAGLTAFATAQGYVARGKYLNRDGLILADPTTGALYTKTRWLTTSKFDGVKRTYRLVIDSSLAASVVKSGIFTVGSKQYFGWDDGRGYILKSKIRCIGKTWYKANSKGVLTNYNSKTTQHIERYVKWAVKIAKNNSHGYSQANRWGPDYDCSSLVCSSLLAAGFTDSGASWTGNMKKCLKTIGFRWHKGTSGIQRGDILLAHNSQHQHTEIYLGNGKNVGAHSSENGGIYGKTGDQTGREISVTNYYNMPWDGYLRYKG